MTAETAVAAEATVTEVSAPSRRDRVRAATSHEIIATARRLLVSEGSAAITLRAIAREMGMTAPALYRYFGSYQTLIHHVVADIFSELSDYVEAEVERARTALETDRAHADRAQAGEAQAGAQAREAQAREAQAREAQANGTTVAMMTACKAFRQWAIAHPAEFGMIFGTPLPGIDLYHEDPVMDCGMRFGAIFMNLFVELWRIKPFAVPADDEIASEFREQLARYRDQLGTHLPLGVLQTFLRCWVSLYGTVTLEVFGHMRFALDNPAQMFELMLTDLAGLIGLRYPLPT
jgi:AcrR family transcriptional regulator